MKTIEILGFKAKVARTFWERTRGLIGTKSLAPGEGLLVEKCNAITGLADSVSAFRILYALMRTR